MHTSGRVDEVNKSWCSVRVTSMYDKWEDMSTYGSKGGQENVRHVLVRGSQQIVVYVRGGQPAVVYVIRAEKKVNKG